MVTREKKQELYKVLLEKLTGASGLYIVNYEGMRVDQAIEIRNAVREVGAEYYVSKNTLIRKAMEEIGTFNIPSEVVVGMSALVISKDDAVAPAKVLKKFMDDNKDIPVLTAASIEGQYFDSSQMKTLATLPSRDDMIAGIMGSLSSPASGIAGSMGALIRDIASIIEEVAKKKAA